MNFGMIRYVLGWVLNFEGIFMMLPCIVALYYKEKEGLSFLIIGAICCILGFLFVYKKPKNNSLYVREGFVTVSLSWIVMSIFGALPFLLNKDIPSYTDALFEMISGFTTTGASILSDVEALSKCSLFWRSFSHFIGGMGVLVFVLAIIQLTGGSGIHLMRAESPGPTVSKLVPKMVSTAKILYGIYIALTLIEMILLFVNGMPIFDSITTSLGTAGTGGFGIKNNSITGYSPNLQMIVGVFMVLFGVNFNVYYLLLIKRSKQAFKSSELYCYLAIIALSTTYITYNIKNLFPNIATSFRAAFFQVGSIITTTGFSTVDFDKWPDASKAILVLLMLIGACAGSTGGGIKVSRFIIAMKSVKNELEYYVHPRIIKKIKMDGKPIDHDVIRSVNVFMVAYILIFALSVLFVTFNGNDLVTNFTAVAATINNIGPGLNLVGPTRNFGFYNDFSKYILMFDMLAGRLELFPMLVLLNPSTWRGAFVKEKIHKDQ